VELRYLLYFATVAEQQSFTRAAEKLRIAQSSISQQIKTLEEELEIKLLLRTKRSVKLTAAGHAFLREAKDILNRIEQSRVEARRRIATHLPAREKSASRNWPMKIGALKSQHSAGISGRIYAALYKCRLFATSYQ
jgi:DNA-binding MarR family transcriptional regulator